MTKKEQNRLCALNGGRGSGRTFRLLFEYYENKVVSLEKQNVKYKEMTEDMKADMCSTKSKVLCDYLVGILKKYGEIV